MCHVWERRKVNKIREFKKGYLVKRPKINMKFEKCPSFFSFFRKMIHLRYFYPSLIPLKTQFLFYFLSFSSHTATFLFQQSSNHRVKINELKIKVLLMSKIQKYHHSFLKLHLNVVVLCY